VPEHVQYQQFPLDVGRGAIRDGSAPLRTKRITDGTDDCIGVTQDLADISQLIS
jgi:hypothetical protein